MCAYRVIQEERAIFWDVLVPVIVRKYVDTNMCIILMAAEIQSYQYTTYIYIYRVSQEERTKLREGVPYVKLYRYNPKHLYPKLNGYGDNGKRSSKL